APSPTHYAQILSNLDLAGGAALRSILWVGPSFTPCTRGQRGRRPRSWQMSSRCASSVPTRSSPRRFPWSSSLTLKAPTAPPARTCASLVASILGGPARGPSTGTHYCPPPPGAPSSPEPSPTPLLISMPPKRSRVSVAS